MSSSLLNLSSLYSDTSGGGLSMLDTIYGIGGSATGTVDPIAALQQAQQNQTQDVKVTAAQPDNIAAISAFTKAVSSAKSMTQLLNNPAFMNVLLTANGMSDQIGYTALATQTLQSSLNDSSSLVNTLSDTRWKTLAQNYDFTSTGLANFQKPATIAAITNLYNTVQWETSQDSVTPGLSNALSFGTTASTITSVDQILGNPTMRTVVTTALGIPKQIAFQDINAQEQAISTRVDVSKFKDPAFVKTFVQQYLIAAAQSASSTSTPDLTSLAVQGQGILV